MTPKTRVDVLPPINWPATLIFIITGLAAVTLVPWYALTFEVSAGAWILAVVLLAITELSITAGYHRLWAHRTYSA
ncbi:MAG: acyl-CoA desaturase, partial [Pseudomonadales bacterium]|nr:acyl-CoA desaturase [Pseudomonadales bacterium]